MTASATAASAARDHAWRAMIGACVCMFCGQPPVAMYTFGVFVPEIVAATHWPQAAIASAIGPGALIAALLSPLLGWATDRFGTRRVALWGGPAFGAGLAVVGLLPQSAAAFVLLTSLMWLLSFAGSPVPYAQMVTGLFDRRRGFALSIVFASGALGIAAWPPYAAWLIDHLGWRAAYAGMGLTAAAAISLSAIFLLRNAVKPGGGHSATGFNGATLREAIATVRFWKIAAVFMILTGVLAGAAVNLPVLLRQHGMSGQGASLVMTTVGLSMLAGRLALAPVLDRWFAPYVTIVIVLLPIAAFGLLMVASDRAMFFVAAGLLGFGLGSEFSAAAYIVGRAFGLRAFGAIYGLITLFYGLGGATGPATIGVALARHAAPGVVFGLCLGLLLVAIAILASFKRSDLTH